MNQRPCRFHKDPGWEFSTAQDCAEGKESSWSRVKLILTYVYIYIYTYICIYIYTYISVDIYLIVVLPPILMTLQESSNLVGSNNPFPPEK